MILLVIMIESNSDLMHHCNKNHHLVWLAQKVESVALLRYFYDAREMS